MSQKDTVDLHEKAVQLLNHLEDVLDEESFGKIDHELWNAVSMFLVNRGIEVPARDPFADLGPTVTYAHFKDREGTRYRQLASDALPGWAADVRPEITDPNALG